MKNKKCSKAALQAAVFIFISFLIVFTAWGGGIRLLTVVSGSMEPEIKTGSVAVISKNITDFKDIGKGDVITFEIGDSLVTHRVAEIIEDGIITKGDANNSEDSWVVTKDMYYGKQLFSVPIIGYIAVFIRQNILFTILIIAAVLITAKIFKERRVQDV